MSASTEKVISFTIIQILAPWYGYSKENLLSNIEKTPIKFDPKVEVSEESKDFLRQCLTIDENQRISWQQVYQHKLFGNYFKAYLE
jgi:serine/threonine protein kinase